MKIALFIVSILVNCGLNGQTNPIRLSLEYSPNLSGPNELGIPFSEAVLAHNVFGKIEIPLSTKISMSTGLGFLQTDFVYYNYSGQAGYKDEQRHYMQHYIVLPAGIKIKYGSFFFQPEVGAAYLSRLKIFYYIVDEEQNRISGKIKYPFSDHSFHWSTLLSTGLELSIKSIRLVTGVKGYVVFNTPGVSMYGAGLLLGVKW